MHRARLPDKALDSGADMCYIRGIVRGGMFTLNVQRSGYFFGFWWWYALGVPAAMR
jgi:hypothetical protein